ncbi:threonine/serine exporter family protein [Clostridium sp. C2-6-12]|uniref:threonine/serine exporter family protein n=1 Tax=Clostridium sp. C2-6-12 TaxID=2698832 RepID=UPI00136FAB5D|nr:threonine/serine exporter family protein [Clostridium sp. C2-6-12]
MLIKMTILSFLGSVFPVILFNIDRKKIIWCGLAGALGWIVYSLTFTLLGSEVIGSFFGAFVVNLYSEFMARIIKTPASMFYVPGIFPLVPGITAYSTIIAIVQSSFNAALSRGILTLAIGGAIAFGIMLSSTIVKLICNIRIKLHSK